MVLIEGMENDLLARHYHQLLGLEEPWQVQSVALDLEAKSVSIYLEHPKGRPVPCPQCHASCTIADHASERRWRHLDTMQFETILIARVPRADCPQCGVKTIEVTWAQRHSRFTLLFEAFVLDVLKAASSISQASWLTGLDWSTLHRLMQRAVERGLERRRLQSVPYLGIDEKSFGRGQSYIGLLNDLEHGAVIEVVEGRHQEAAERLFGGLSPELRQSVLAVCMDMWPAFIKSCSRHLPEALIVHDRFHISKHLNEAVDQVRRGEHRGLRRAQDQRLKGTRYLWLTNPENLSEEKASSLEALRRGKLKTGRAWSIKEFFAEFWHCFTPEAGEAFFKRWYSWAIRCRLAPVKKVARMLKKHLTNILTWFRASITNAASEGLNSKIQGLKAAARGFRSFEHYRTRILFFCGQLDLSVPLPVHP